MVHISIGHPLNDKKNGIERNKLIKNITTSGTRGSLTHKGASLQGFKEVLLVVNIKSTSEAS